MFKKVQVIIDKKVTKGANNYSIKIEKGARKYNFFLDFWYKLC